MNVGTFDGVFDILFELVLIVAVVTLVTIWTRRMLATTRIASEEYRSLRALAQMQADALDAVVSCSVSSLVDQELWQQLIDAHERSRTLLGTGRKHK